MSIPQIGGGLVEHHTQLAEYFALGSKPKPNWKIGTEHEKFVYNKKTGLPLPYSGQCSIETILKSLQNLYGWNPIFENQYLIGLEKGGANVSLEPGGQLELSGAPLETIHATCNESNEHLDQVRKIAEKIGAGFIGLGAAPNWIHEEMPMMPKGRYALMTDYMKKIGSYGTQMMYRTCTIQVNLDYSSEIDMVKKFRVALALQPLATALFANSPLFEGKLVGYKSWRSRVWQDLDSDRTGMLPFVFEDGMGFERYVDYALDVPMYFVYRNGQYINALGQSFRDFMKGKLPALPGQLPQLSDWADHLTTIFPEVRLKQFLEMRGADGGQWNQICALPAFWVGVLYDQNSLDAAWDICKNWTADQREALRLSAAKDGLDGKVESISIQSLAKEILKISTNGLNVRNKLSNSPVKRDESHFLDILSERVETGITPADTVLLHYNGKWRKNSQKIFEEFSY
jgi:glutamate--cysteine ligase